MKALQCFFENTFEVNDFRRYKGEQYKKSVVNVMFSDLNPGEEKLYIKNVITKKSGLKYIQIRYTSILQSSGSIDSNYEIYSEKLDEDSKKVKEDFSWMFDSKYFTKHDKIMESEEIPDEFKQMIHDKIESGKWKNVSKKRFQSTKAKYIAKHVDLSNYATISAWEPLKITRNNLTDQFGNFFFIPAVQDIEKETKYSGSGKTNINNLMNYILEQMQDSEQTQKRKEEIETILQTTYRLSEDDSEINKLKNQLNEILKNFDNSSISFKTKTPNISKMVRDSLKIFIDDGVKTEVQYKGHGLQRYFLVSLFKAWYQKLVEIKTKSEEVTKSTLKVLPVCSSAYFAIEEPELFLHPQYQRMMKDYLQEISFTENNQIILNSHSPNFIEFGYVEEVIKVIKKSSQEGTTIIQPVKIKDGDLVAPEFLKVWGPQESKEKYRKINKVNMCYYLNRERNELFFADMVVLVEGQTEKMLLDAWARYFFPTEIAMINNVSYVDCLGKFNFQQYIPLMKEYKIPFVVIVDADTHKKDSTRNNNIHIKKDTFDAGGLFIEVEPEFEDEFNIESFDEDSSGYKKHKPYYAFEKYFDVDTGEAIKEEIEKLRYHKKLNQIFKAIFGKSIPNK